MSGGLRMRCTVGLAPLQQENVDQEPDYLIIMDGDEDSATGYGIMASGFYINAERNPSPNYLLLHLVRRNARGRCRGFGCRLDRGLHQGLFTYEDGGRSMVGGPCRGPHTSSDLGALSLGSAA